MWACVKCKCVFSPWPIHDPVACLPSVYFNLSSLLSVSSRMLGLILHCCLSLWIHLLVYPALFPSPLYFPSSLCHVLCLYQFSECPDSFCFLSLSPLIFRCCFAASVSVIFTYCFSPCLSHSLTVSGCISLSLPPSLLSLSLSFCRLDASSSRHQAAS